MSVISAVNHNMILMWWVGIRLSLSHQDAELNDSRLPCFLIFTHLTDSDHFSSDLGFTVQHFKANAKSYSSVTKPPAPGSQVDGAQMDLESKS